MSQSLDEAPSIASPHVTPPAGSPVVTSPAHRGRSTPWTRLRLGRFGDLVRPSFVLAAVVVAIAVVFAVAPGILAPADPLATDVAHKLNSPSAAHWFGTDDLGRDIFSRFIHGSHTTLTAAVLALAIAFVVSVVLGLLAGSLGGAVDEVVMRFVDIMLALPGLLVALMLMTALGFGTLQIAIAVGVSSVATFTRVMRSEVLKARRREFVTAALIAGLPRHRVIRRHVLPHALGPVVALTALELGAAILSISALSFLGYGAPPPAPEWGSMIAEGRSSLAYAWWVATLPGAAVVIVVLAVNRISRAVERVTA